MSSEDTPSHCVLNDISGADARSKTQSRQTNGRGVVISPSINQFVDGNGEDFVFDEVMKRGKCYICDVDLSSKQLAHQHLNGKAHEKKKRRSLLSPHLVPAASQLGSYSDIPICKLCNAPFSSELNMRQHFAGARHKKELLKWEGSKSVQERHNVKKHNPEQTVKKALFQSSVSPSGLCAVNKMLTKSNELGVRPEPWKAQENSGLSFFPAGNDLITTHDAIQTIGNGSDDSQMHRSLSNNLSEFNSKEKQMVLREVDIDPQKLIPQPMSSIVDNNQQPSLPFHPRVSEPMVVENNQADQVNHLTIQDMPNHNVMGPQLSPLLPMTNSPIEGHGNALVKDYNTTNLPSPRVSVLGKKGKGKEYEFDGVKGFCKACDVVLTSWKQAQQHLNGQQHRKKSERWGEMPLLLLEDNVIRSNNDSESKSTSFSYFPDESNKVSQSQNYYSFDGNKGFCQACNTDLSSFLQATQHIDGKQHKRNVLRMRTAEQGILHPLYCGICQKTFTGQESARAHFISEKHQRNEALLKSDAHVLYVFDQGRKLWKNGETWYFCDKCRKPLNTLEQLNIHRRSHNLSEIESPRGSPRHFFGSGDSNENVSAFGYQGMCRSERQKSHGSVLDCQVSFEQIKELLTFGENPVVNAEFSPSVSETLNHVLLPQETVSSGEFHGDSKPGNFKGSRHIKGRDYFMGQTFRNDAQYELKAEGSSPNNQVSPDWTNTSQGFQSIKQQHNGASEFIFNIIRPNDDCVTSVNASRKAVYHTNITEKCPTEDVLETLGSYTISGQENNSIFGNITTRVKTSAIKSGTRDCGYKNVVNLDQAEKEESSDSDEDGDDHESTVMNIQGEEKQPMTDTDKQVRKLQSSHELGLRKKYYCDLCRKQMNAKKSFKEHLDGKLHQSNLSSSKVPIQLQTSREKSFILQTEDFERAFNITKNLPRRYQVNLMEKAMSSDCVVYLPTGTGKTMVSVLTIGLMLEKNPKRPVIFLVDKVLLVIQQAKYIKTEFEGKKFKRASLQRNPDDEDNVELVERELSLAFVCGGLLCTNNLPIWQHDIIVTTVDYCMNMLNNDSILWEHFSLAVLDEVHHCVKKHPYRRLLQDYHLRISDSKRPKILGLTASPAGKSTAEATYTMLKTLLQELGGAKIAFVGEECQVELKSFQSNPSLHPICVPLTDKEQYFQSQCIKYFLQCYIKLAPLSSTLRNCKDPPCSFFYDVLKEANQENLQGLTDSLLKDAGPLSDILPFILQAECITNADERDKNSYESLRHHTFKVVLHIADIPTGLDFDELKDDFKESETNHVLNDVKRLGLPCDTFYKQILAFEQVEGNCETAMIGKLIQILKDVSYIDWAKKDSMALVLVRQRKNAKSLSRSLKNKAFVQNNSLRVACLVGHGKGTQDKGMAVKDQKKVLDNQKKYNILVATSIAEEGVDIKTVELVVSMNPPSNVTALVQMRGRARKKGSYFFILCSSQEEMRKLKELQQHEKNMMEAAKKCFEGQ